LGPFGQALAIIQAGIAGVRGASAISRINSTQIEGGGGAFALGGPVFGPSHQAGGIKFSVGGQVNEMEGDEIILTKGVYQNPVLRGIASDLNVMGGGRSFALGGPVLQDRPMVPTNTSTSTLSANLNGGAAQSNSNALSNREIMEVLMRIEQNTKQTADKPVLALTQIKTGIESLYDVENDATF
jgi:hypothetical protein